MFHGDRNSRLFASARASQPVICVFLFAKSQSYYFLAYYLQYEILAYNLQYANNEQKNNMTVIWNKMVDNFRTTHYWYTSCTYVVRNFKSFRLVKNSMFVMKTFQNVKNVHTIVRNILRTMVWTFLTFWKVFITNIEFFTKRKLLKFLTTYVHDVYQ